jgi:cell division protein FtsL
MTIMRLLHLIVVAAFVCAAVYVYKIKFDATVQAERVAKLRTEIRRERDAIASLRAEWSKIDNPTRIQSLIQRHLALRPMEATQFDSFDRLPERPADLVPPDISDPIGAMIDMSIPDYPTGSVKTPAAAR